MLNRTISNTSSKVNEATVNSEKSASHDTRYCHVPILAMTADVFQATYDECIKCGMDGYVAKPFDEEQLYSAVAHFFESHGGIR